MTKQTKSLTTFTELPPSELHQISGGDWWSDLSKLFPKKDKVTSDKKYI
ncbi:ComC/BlpC family leader-containing pheromone/bacteriocin [Streptococcus suis]